MVLSELIMVLLEVVQNLHDRRICQAVPDSLRSLAAH